MALETATYISQLVATNPPGNDPLAQSDDHHRLVKSVLQNQFPSLGAAAVTVTAAQLNSLAASGGLFSVGTSTTSLTIGTGTQTFTTQASLGFAVGQNIKITSNADATAYMAGTCTAYNSTTGAMSVSVTTTGGAGTVASWSITVLVAPQGVASATVDLLSGTAVASAATINLDTATGNRVHVTGTTTITAVTLTRGPRTVIFDGVLTLTHHATNNNLPGAANITTAAGDRAIYESDGPTVYCVGYFRKDGTAVTGAGDSAVVLNTGNGHGSTNTKIRRFTTAETNIGTAITYADSATLGASFTINETGLYAISYVDTNSTAFCLFGVSLNSAQLTTSISGITAANRLASNANNSSTNATGVVTYVTRLVVNDVIRPHTDGNPDTASSYLNKFSIRKVGV